MRIIQSRYEKDPFALKQCLSGQVLNCVTGCKNNYDEMLKRLDDRFDKSRKIVDLVVNELKLLKKLSDSDSRGFIKMVETVDSNRI